MVVHVKNLDGLVVSEHEECSIFFVNPKTPNPHLSRFEKFGVQARVKGILLEKMCLFFKFSCKPMLSEICLNIGMDRENIHDLK